MKKIIKITLVSLVVLMAVSLFGCAEFERLFLGGDPYSFSDIVMTQVGVDEFKIEFTANCGKDDVTVYFTEGFRLSESVKPVEVKKTVDGKNARFSFVKKLNLGEDYYLWLVKGDEEAKTSVTVPSAFPSIAKNEDGSATFSFNYTYGTSWGSFCDPTGKSVYKSSSPTFDDSAVRIAENIEITQETCVIPAELFDENCYYFSVSDAKEGSIRSISSPLVLPETVYGQFRGYSAKITDDLKLEVKVNIPDGSLVAAKAQTSLQLVIKSDTAEEVYLGNCVYAGGVATMAVDLTSLIFDGLWYDVLLAWDGAIITDVPKTQGGVAVDTVSTVKKDGIVYSITGWKPDDRPDLNEMMKVYFEEDTTKYADEILKSYLVSFTTDPVPTLNVTVKLKDGVSVPTLDITGGDKVKLATAQGVLNDDGSYTYSLPVSRALTEADKWYDLRFFIGNTPYEMLKDSCIAYADFAAKYEDEVRIYEFREWNGMLKLMYTDVSVSE